MKKSTEDQQEMKTIVNGNLAFLHHMLKKITRSFSRY